jgi:hypothetical protein
MINASATQRLSYPRLSEVSLLFPHQPAILDRFIPQSDAGGRHEITIRAPAALVLNIARNFDIESVRAVSAIFWLRAKLLHAPLPDERPFTGLVANMENLGWRCLAEEAGHYYAAGAVCQPWVPDVIFSAVPPDQFASYAAPDQVKIAWTIEADPLGPALTRFATETRAVATDAPTRVRFRGYWRKFGIGIILIRRLLLPAIRREAERQWKASASASVIA